MTRFVNNSFHRFRGAIAASAVVVLTSALSIVQAFAQVESEERVAAPGVRINVVADSWTGVPANIGQIEPLMITIENSGTVPLRLRYAQFAVISRGGNMQSALPPFEIRGTLLVDPAFTPGAYPYPVDGFWVAPHLSRYYPGFRPFDGPFAYDPWYFSVYYPTFAA